MNNFIDWHVQPPPKNTWVWGAYSLEKNDWQLFKTCKRGCCVHTALGSMILPNYWREATEEEVKNEENYWNALPEINTDLY